MRPLANPQRIALGISIFLALLCSYGAFVNSYIAPKTLDRGMALPVWLFPGLLVTACATILTQISQLISVKIIFSIMFVLWTAMAIVLLTHNNFGYWWITLMELLGICVVLLHSVAAYYVEQCKNVLSKITPQYPLKITLEAGHRGVNYPFKDQYKKVCICATYKVTSEKEFDDIVNTLSTYGLSFYPSSLQIHDKRFYNVYFNLDSSLKNLKKFSEYLNSQKIKK